MNSRLLIPAAAAVTLALAGCEQQAAPAAKTDTAAAASAVEQVEQEMLAAFQAKDAARLTAHYADDGVLATPGRAALKGKDAIGKANAEDFADPSFKVTFANEKTEVAASGDLAYTVGSFNVTFTNPETKQPVSSPGSYITLFKKQADGTWKVAADFAVPAG